MHKSRTFSQQFFSAGVNSTMALDKVVENISAVRDESKSLVLLAVTWYACSETAGIDLQR